jgi:hypothetical protein
MLLGTGSETTNGTSNFVEFALYTSRVRESAGTKVDRTIKEQSYHRTNENTDRIRIVLVPRYQRRIVLFVQHNISYHIAVQRMSEVREF